MMRTSAPLSVAAFLLRSMAMSGASQDHFRLSSDRNAITSPRTVREIK